MNLKKYEDMSNDELWGFLKEDEYWKQALIERAEISEMPERLKLLELCNDWDLLKTTNNPGFSRSYRYCHVCKRKTPQDYVRTIFGSGSIDVQHECAICNVINRKYSDDPNWPPGQQNQKDHGGGGYNP